MADIGVFERKKSLDDYLRLQEEFDLQKQKLKKELASGIGASDPAAVKEWQFYSQLPEQEKQRYLQMKRADQIMNLGSQLAVRSPTGGITEYYGVTPKVEETPMYQAAQAAEKERAQGYQQFLQEQLPKASGKAEQALKTISEMRGPGGAGLSEDVRAIVGFRSPLGGAIPFTEDPNMPGLPRVVPGSPAASGRAKVRQAQGQVFLEAYESLNGAGALTQIEGLKGEQAKARLDAAQDEKSFEHALDELEGIIKTSASRLGVKKTEAEKYLRGISPASQNRYTGNPAIGQNYEDIPSYDIIPEEPRPRLRYNPATGEFE
jgi:hypothetical protein